MQKKQWPPPFWNSQGSLRISIGSHSFPVHAFPSFPAFRASKNSRDTLPRNPRELHTTYLELSCWNKFPFTNAIGEPVNGHEDYCVSYCCRFQGIHTTLIIYLATKNHVGRTSIKVTTHSSSKSLDFLCKYFMLQLPEFFGYEIKFQTIQEVTRRGRHRFTLKMLLRSAAIICFGGVKICYSLGRSVAWRHNEHWDNYKTYGREGKCKNIFAQGKIKWKKFMHAK